MYCKCVRHHNNNLIVNVAKINEIGCVCVCFRRQRDVDGEGYLHFVLFDVVANFDGLSWSRHRSHLCPRSL